MKSLLLCVSFVNLPERASCRELAVDEVVSAFVRGDAFCSRCEEKGFWFRMHEAQGSVK